MGQDQSRGGDGSAGPTAGQGPGGAAVGIAGSQGSAVATVPLAGIEGFQVVRLLPYSPAHKAGLVPFFDIITALDHAPLELQGSSALQYFKSYIANHRDRSVCFSVFNLYVRAYRDVYCVPSDAWGGGGLLGCSIEWSRAETCPERCVHVVDILEGSPAADSGEFCANRDYIIGMQTIQEPLISLIKNQKDFYSRVEGWHEEQRWLLERKQRFPSEAVEVPHVLLFLVYNSEENTVREVAVEMGTSPEATLGMSVATGLLHVIPSAVTVGGAATELSLPVMSRFVKLEASRAITSTIENPAPTTPQPPPPYDAPQGQEPHPHYPPQDAYPHPEGGSAPQDCSHDGESAPVAPVVQDKELLSATLSPPPTDAAADSTGAPLDDYPTLTSPPSPPPPQTLTSQDDRLQVPAPPMPPPPMEGFIPPLRNAVPATAMGPSSQALVPPPAAHKAHLAKKSPLLSALASMEAYEHPSGAGSLHSFSGTPSHLRAQQPQLQPWTQPPGVNPPAQSQQPPAPQSVRIEAAEAVPLIISPHTEPPAASNTPLASAHGPSNPPSAPAQPLQQHPQPESQRTAFSRTNMPPPLHYPVFPGAALRHPTK
ncbi:putative Golgi reassembly stacking protein (GRASP) [Leptomonas seymouri]|uniref:Putative Golgi reassembly stacking protein (GRASP) n=1 Tax=Leptomonas seymouri TaxID=5684 RepID=A0A0N1ILQ2_LEPSE|nr:putative Golgi reassembly stacking protein (GRASP) [Leptomonas seymouri]|eukprot:KPI88128.1 putative Golgi reassembly stacking protein (GRASP) [Leptomonas seymouri]